MVYMLKRIDFSSAVRIGLLLGWVVALLPALLMAWMLTQGIAQVAGIFAGVDTYSLSLLGEPVFQLDLLDLVGLTGAAQTTTLLAAHNGLTFVGFTTAFVLLGSLFFLIGTIWFCFCYNLFAQFFGGIRFELAEPPLA